VVMMRTKINCIREYHLFLPYVIFLMFVLTLCLVQSQQVFAAETKPYTEYIAEHSNASRNNDAVVLKADQYAEGSWISFSEGFLKAGSDSTVTYKFTLPKAGLYYINLKYKPVAGGSEIIRKLYINSEVPFKEAGYITLKRYYRDKNQEYKNQKGNQTFPSQVEAEVWSETLLSSADGYIIDPLAFYLQAGENTLTIEAVESEILMDTITLTPSAPLPDYKTYLQNCTANGSQVYKGAAIKVQAEDAVLKSSPNLYPTNDRTSSLTEPYNPSYIILNTIGGNSSWRMLGQEINWEVNAPKAGLYKLAFRYKQSNARGSFSTRKLSVNGVVPFEEANDLRFKYNTKFSLSYLSDRETGEDYFFYLNEGKNNISMEVSLGAFGDLTSRVQNVMSNLNGIYQDVIVITGATPDKYRDYKLNILIPDLFPRLKAERDKLQGIVDDINNISGSFTSSTSSINMLIVILDKMIKDPNKIGTYLPNFKSSMTALGDWMINIQRQPLELDYLILTSDDYKLPRAEGNFSKNIVHRFRAFLGSFFVNFNGSSETASGQKAKTIDVWVSTGRDQYNILQRMVNESFSKQNDINVNLKLVGADVVFPATLTGNGPDVNIQVAASTPINFGYRGGAYDLTQFPDFNEVASRFAPAALDTFRYKGACYAIPDQMSFNVMFYRTDIFKKLNIEVPKTLDEFLAIVPILQKNNMDIYFTSGAQNALGAAGFGGFANVNPVYVSLLYQNGGQLYQNDGERADIASNVGIKVFKYWTELATKHKFIVQTDFTTRFRTGEIPVGIVDFSLFNSLSVAAPEIKGDWAMAQIPGSVQSDGSVRYDNPVTVSGSMIVKNIAEKKGTLNEGWEFLKWWTSTETQHTFAREMESVLGLAGRYPVANLEAFKKIPWGKENLKVLKDSLQWIRTVPQVPGSYITGRVINNAYVSVVTETSNVNPTDAIYKALDELNQELTDKRKEFNIK
jgi:ABC-type glycerol-3-phosphate transport system substrate-binding protein